MSHIEKILEAWADDCQIDKHDLDSEALQTPQLVHKYLHHYYQIANDLSSAGREFDYMVAIKSQYYMGILPQEELNRFGWKPYQLKIPKTDLPTYLAGDIDLLHIRKRMDELNHTSKVIENILRDINGRTWQIKNAIEWKKFTSGGY